MANIFDVAVYVLRKQKTMTAMKLQKLVYYAQAWTAVWDSKPLFPEHFEAWANGPVAPSLYAIHKGRYKIDFITFLGYGNDKNLTQAEKENINQVLAMYGKKTPEYLSILTHQERPWKYARRGMSESERGNAEITIQAMVDYYGEIYK